MESGQLHIHTYRLSYQDLFMQVGLTLQQYSHRCQVFIEKWKTVCALLNREQTRSYGCLLLICLRRKVEHSIKIENQWQHIYHLHGQKHLTQTKMSWWMILKNWHQSLNRGELKLVLCVYLLLSHENWSFHFLPPVYYAVVMVTNNCQLHTRA